MAGVQRRGKTYRAYYWDGDGIKHYITLPSGLTKAEALRKAGELEVKHRRCDAGLEEPATNSLEIAHIMQEYMTWGRQEGGRHGHGWSSIHAKAKQRNLEWWAATLKLKVMRDLVRGLAGPVDKVLVQLAADGLASKSRANRLEPLTSFCEWAYRRDYLPLHPLSKLTKPSMQPQRKRRALTEDEVMRLLACCDPDRRLTYEVALESGLRANELRSLTIQDVDVIRSGLRLDPRWTKNRDPHQVFQPLTETLTRRLADVAARKDAKGIYRKQEIKRRRGTLDRARYDEALLYVPSSPVHGFNKDLDRAGIPKVTEDGIADFHSLRVTFASRLGNLGAHPKDIQALMRQKDLYTTLRYDQSLHERRTELIGKLDTLVPSKPKPRARRIHAVK